MISVELLESLSPNQTWKLQDIAKKSKYEIGTTVILFHCPQNKSCFRNKFGNPRKLGSVWKVVFNHGDSVLCEEILENGNRTNRKYTIHKKYLIDLPLWRDIQLEYLFK